MNEKKIKLKKLTFLYILIIALTISLVGPPHIFPQPYFMPLRFPHYLEQMKPFLGVSWPMSFQIYHYAIYSLIIIGTINILGIFFYPKFRRIVLISSGIGVILFSLMALFFFFKFINVNASTAIAYGLYSAALLIVNSLTFRAVIKKQTEA